jgi:predicted NAD/FAD-binding protein
MRIAVIGAGGAGMTAAYYLAAKHDVVLLEKQAVAGGSVRTVNRNVCNSSVARDVYLDNGVIEFHVAHSPTLIALMAELEIPLERFIGGSSSLYRIDGRSFHMPGGIRRFPGMISRIQNRFRLAWLMRYILPIIVRLKHAGDDAVVGDVLGQDGMSNWLRMLVMYGYSMPFNEIDDFPATLAAQTLKQGSLGTRWLRIPGGVYTYMERILKVRGERIELRTSQADVQVSKNDTGLIVQASGQTEAFDRVVIATPPDQVLSIIEKPGPLEKELFSVWEPNIITTVIHRDTSIYDRWEIPAYMEFDVFEKDEGRDAGYNAYLNRLSGLPENSGSSYFLAFNLEDRIDPSLIVDRQVHHTPRYTRQSYATQNGIKALSGTDGIYFAGAYLNNGLHEGAVKSGFTVSQEMV